MPIIAVILMLFSRRAEASDTISGRGVMTALFLVLGADRITKGVPQPTG